MFCSQCGKELPEGAAFCSGCGAAVSEKVQIAGQLSKGHTVMNRTVFQPQSTEVSRKEKKRKKIPLWEVGGAVLGLIGIVFCVIFLIDGLETAGFSYVINGDTVTITRYRYDSVEVVIPNKIKGKPVTSIGDRAFVNCKSLETISIPESVTSIGYTAFGWCESLKTISIPESVTSIGEGAFHRCSSLEKINIPKGVTCISNGTFAGCTSLKSINIPDGVTIIDWYAFDNCKSLKSIYIPSSVTEIGGFAFRGCDDLENIYGEDMASYAASYASSNGYNFIPGKMSE